MSGVLVSKPAFYFCDVWRMNYYFFLGWKWSDFTKYIEKNYDHKPTNTAIPTGQVLQINKDDGGCIMCIWVEKKNDYATLAHESLHAANWTLERAGWVPDLRNDEPQSYLMTNIFRKALEMTKPKKRGS